MTSISTSESLLPAFPPPCIIMVVYVRTPVAARRGVARRDKSRQQAACVPFIHLPQPRTLGIGPHVLDSIMPDSTAARLQPPDFISRAYGLAGPIPSRLYRTFLPLDSPSLGVRSQAQVPASGKDFYRAGCYNSRGG